MASFPSSTSPPPPFSFATPPSNPSFPTTYTVESAPPTSTIHRSNSLPQTTPSTPAKLSTEPESGTTDISNETLQRSQPEFLDVTSGIPALPASIPTQSAAQQQPPNPTTATNLSSTLLPIFHYQPLLFLPMLHLPPSPNSALLISRTVHHLAPSPSPAALTPQPPLSTTSLNHPSQLPSLALLLHHNIDQKIENDLSLKPKDLADAVEARVAVDDHLEAEIVDVLLDPNLLKAFALLKTKGRKLNHPNLANTITMISTPVG